MAVEIYIEEKLGRNWVKEEGVFFTGCFFYDKKLLTEDEVYENLSKISDFDALKSLINHLSGFFSFIIHRDNNLFAAVDHVRSIPLFYTFCTENFLISNDAEYIRKTVGDNELDPIALQEFSGNMVCMCETLFKSTKQIQVGEVIAIKNNNSIEKYRYFAFTHSEKYMENDSYYLEEQLLQRFSESIDRLIQYANGRQLVLPLSAGYDSRFIALMLYKKGVKNVLCYSYGQKGNFEAEISKQVADILGFNWVFIEYTDELWREWSHTDEYLRYLRIACNWVSLPHTQDWPAVWQLKITKKISDTSVFIAGYGGDAVAGSGIPFISNFNKKISIRKFILTLFILNYRNLQYLPKDISPNRKRGLCRIMTNRVIDNLEIDSIETVQDFANFKEKWDWLEFNPKFIVNAVRVYEFWGYDWYLPFVDKDFMEYWKDVPLCLRSGKKMYNEVVDNFFSELTGKQPPHHKEIYVSSTIVKFIKEKMNYTWLHRMYLKFLFLLKKSSLEKNDTNCMRGKYDKEIVERYSHYRGGMNFLEVILFLREVPNIMKLEL